MAILLPEHLDLFSFMCKLSTVMSYIMVLNLAGKTMSLKGGTCIGSISFETVRNLSNERNYVSHFHVDLDGSFAFCGYSKDTCPVLN